MRSECRWLVLVPTEMEKQYLSIETSGDIRVELCGFGPVTAAARTAALIDRCRPAATLLCGIAGALSADIELGSAFQFRTVACYGIGAGTGTSFMTAEQMGWRQWTDNCVTIGDKLQLNVADDSAGAVGDLLVSVSAVSTDENDVLQKKSVFPEGIAEDMEGFAVAAAAEMAGIPTFIARGVSNTAGDRNKQNWQVESAMKSVDELAQKIIRTPL